MTMDAEQTIVTIPCQRRKTPNQVDDRISLIVVSGLVENVLCDDRFAELCRLTMDAEQSDDRQCYMLRHLPRPDPESSSSA